MVAKLKGTIDMNIIIAYAPTAAAETTEKETFFKILHNTSARFLIKHKYYVTDLF